MDKPNILVAMPYGPVFDTFFDKENKERLETLGNVVWNETGRQFTAQEMAGEIRGKDVCISGWGTPSFEGAVLAQADKLRLIAHNAGSVRPYVSDAAFEKGIRVCCGNRVFAQSVAEGVIAYALSVLRDIPAFSGELKKGNWPESFYNRGILGRHVGIVGFGMIAEYLVQMLQVFDCPISVYSNHISRETLEKYGMKKRSLAEVFETCDIVSLHCGMTDENYHLVNEGLLSGMKDGALLINTARGAVIDEVALVRVLQKRKNLYAALDVFEQEPLPKDSPLLQCENALLIPHMGGPTIDRRRAVTAAVLTDIENFLQGKPLDCEITGQRAAKMSTH